MTDHNASFHSSEKIDWAMWVIEDVVERTDILVFMAEIAITVMTTKKWEKCVPIQATITLIHSAKFNPQWLFSLICRLPSDDVRTMVLNYYALEERLIQIAHLDFLNESVMKRCYQKLIPLVNQELEVSVSLHLHRPHENLNSLDFKNSLAALKSQRIYKKWVILPFTKCKYLLFRLVTAWILVVIES